MPGPGAHNISISSPTKCHYWPENSTYQQVGFCTISLVKGFITLVNTNTVSRLFIIDFSIKVVWFPNNKLHFSNIMLLHLVAVVELIAKLYSYIFKYKTDPQNEFSFLVVNTKFTPSLVFAFVWIQNLAYTFIGICICSFQSTNAEDSSQYRTQFAQTFDQCILGF